MHRNLVAILSELLGYSELPGAEIYMIIVRNAGIDPRTTSKYTNWLRNHGLIKNTRGQKYKIDNYKIEELLYKEKTRQNGHTTDKFGSISGDLSDAK